MSNRDWHKLGNRSNINKVVFEYKFIKVNFLWNSFEEVLIKSNLVISMSGTAAEQAVGLSKPVIQIEGDGPQFTKSFAEAQRRLLGRYVFCATNYKNRTQQIHQTSALILKVLYFIKLDKIFMILQ